MAAIISALDNYTTKQFGENGHSEYGWSNSMREKILQFSFQLTRTSEDGVKSLQVILSSLLTTLKHNVIAGSIPEKQVARGYLSVLYRMIGHTRDIIDGKGECTLTYMMIHTWYSFFPQLASFALKCLVDLEDKTVHQYGSWKDIKYFCEYCKSQGENVFHPLIQYAIQLVNDQLKLDAVPDATNISLTAKWVPREKSSFGWLYESFASNYFREILETANTNERQRRAVLKCKTQYRKLLSSLNTIIDTTQVKQCGKKWTEIDFAKVTSITIAKQKKAFLNKKKDGSVRFLEDKDRIECAEHFQSRIKQAVAGEVVMKGKRVGMSDFTKQACELLHSKSQMEIDLLNSQWRDNLVQTGALGNMIAMVDVSASMEGDPMEVAIALGIRIAEKSALGKRVMTFSTTPTWVNLEPYSDFVSMVGVVKRAEWGMNTNFEAAHNLILDAIIQNKMAPVDVQNMILVVLSDMQMDTGDRCDKEALYEKMESKYAAAGVRVHGKPYKPPHILFWNLKSSSGFPSLSSQANCSMMSGFSPALLNFFCEQGIDALQSCTPWSVLEKTLENERYKIMADRLEQEIEV
jgi:hypothetical protein